MFGGTWILSSVDRLEEVRDHEPADLPAQLRSILIRIAEVEARPHTSIVDLLDHVLESVVVARFTGHEAVE